MTDGSNNMHTVGDSLGMAALMTNVVSWLPSGVALLATIAALIWYGLQIYDWVQTHRRLK
jgi:hypothetical protein